MKPAVPVRLPRPDRVRDRCAADPAALKDAAAARIGLIFGLFQVLSFRTGPPDHLCGRRCSPLTYIITRLAMLANAPAGSSGNFRCAAHNREIKFLAAAIKRAVRIGRYLYWHKGQWEERP